MIHLTLKTVFDHTPKHLENRQKYSAARRIFNSLLSVWDCDQTRSFVFDRLLETLKSFYKPIVSQEENTGSTSVNPKAKSPVAFKTKNIKIK